MIKIRNYRNNMRHPQQLNFKSKGWENIPDTVLALDKFKNSSYGTTFADKDRILNALEDNDVEFLRELSKYYMSISGIYQRLVDYMASSLTYDWYAYPMMGMAEDVDVDSIEQGMNEVLEFFDSLYLKTTLREISERVLTEGSYYGYIMTSAGNKRGAFLELPSDYCRSRFKYNGIPAVEFNLKYFEDEFRDVELRENILDSFPEEFKKNYNLYVQGSLPVDPVDRGVWFVCDMDRSMKFTLTENDIPLFAAVIPTILNLDEAKQLDFKKTTQELLKIIIQKMPLDKNSDLVFDIEESQAMHNGACQMLSNATNVDVLTTFADIDVADLDSSSGMATRDPLAKVERGIFNEAGVSQNVFATDGNLSLEKSILNDEAIMFGLLGQYQNRLNALIEVLFNKSSSFKISFPHISIYNNERKQKLYRDMATNGYSKMLPAIAGGMSQTEFLSLNEYEEKILKLGERLVPVQSSNTLSSKDQKNAGESEGKVGAPKKEEGEVAEKTIQNKESES